MLPDFHHRTRVAFLLLSCLIGFGVSRAHAQTQNVEQAATYVSQIDEDLTIRRVSVLPVIDNVDGIYARPIEAQLISLVKESHRWDFIESNLAGSVPTPGEMEENPNTVIATLRAIETDAVFVGAASRGPNGLSLKIDLFLKKDGKLLAQEVLRDHPRFEIPEIRQQIRLLYRKLIAKIPYEGLILSRQGQRVTINLGKADGLAKDQIVNAVQIISVNRHPKFNFLVSSEKEILGKIKILKVDETLSFGSIVSEKERGAIRRLAKISALEQVNYPEPDSLGAGQEGDINSRPDSPVTFGKDPREWVPAKPPAFGQVGFSLGFGSYDSSVALNTTGSLEAKSSFYPTLTVHGELWLNPNWIARAEIAQGVISTKNPRSGSSPENLNHALSKYSLHLGYNFLLRDDFFGPKIQVSAGFGSYRMFVDDSQPQALTTTTFSGLMIGLGGSFPISEEKIWYAGGKLNVYLMPNMSESPAKSGDPSNITINDFSLFGEKKIGENLKATFSLDFSLYSASLSGDGTRTGPGGAERASSLSQRHTTASGGIVYMF